MIETKSDDIERPEAPKLDQRFTADGALDDARDVVVATTNASLFAYVADGNNGLKVIQLTSPASQPKFYGFSPEPKPELIAWRKTASPAVSLAKGLDRDRAVDETGGQIAVFGRIGSRPFTLTNQGKARWMIVEESFNADKLIEFLVALVKDANRKVFLILDNLRVHHSKVVKAWLADKKAQIEVFYLPSYSPELNADERLNADLKYAIGSKVAARTKTKLKEAASSHMRIIEQSPERVKKYFQDPRVAYAAS